MKEMVAFCGIVCTECPTFQATQQNDNQYRAKIAEEWSKQFKTTLKPEDINCDGCLSIGTRHIGYCSVCEIRKCGTEKKLTNCGYCVEYPCGKLADFLSKAPQAKAKLEATRKKK
jgi:hypothetical protein